MVADALMRAHEGGVAVEIMVVSTTGDRVQDRPLAEIGGKALWTKELDRALMDRAIDLAVHSMKDVETDMAAGIALAAVLPRADARDRLVGASSLAALPPGATVGTSSPRREAQLRARRPDVAVTLLRGNVATRLAAVAEKRVDATFLAAAGLDRLGLEAGHALALDDWLPAASQGVVGMTIRSGDEATADRLAAIDHAPTRRCLTAERALLAALGGGCHTAIAAHATIEQDALSLRAEWLLPDGTERVAAQARDPDPGSLGARLASDLLAAASPALRATVAAASA
jgi:hydroxymethylbilane synthase